MAKLADLAQRPDFRLGDLHVSPARRRVRGPAGTRYVEPQFMLVLLRLLDAAGHVVTRPELFEQCWGDVAAVGDDSLNRAIRGARQVATAVGSSAFAIETIPRTGYRLTLAAGVAAPVSSRFGADDRSLLATMVEEAFDRWRAGMPQPDHDAIDALRSPLLARGGDAHAWGIYALLLRKAAEYASQEDCALFVRDCERAARRALSLDPSQSDAQVALVGLVPLFGNWAQARERLLAIREAAPLNMPAAHDAAVLEMATGRPSAAKPIVEELIGRDPLAATFYYKRMFHLWTFGQLAELERVSARALQLWPSHPAIWNARLWTLLFTGRAGQALQWLSAETCRPPMPSAALELLQRTCAVVAAEQSGKPPSKGARDAAVAAAVAAASRGPAQAAAALLSLNALNAIDEAFEVASGYYLGRGSAVTPLRWNANDPSITDQHRRVTQLLFVPAAEAMRADPRFMELCRDIGLTGYWEHCGMAPDFQSSN